MILDPIQLFKEAVAKYPKVKGLFGVLAALALVVIALSLRVSPDYAVFGVVIVLGLLALVALVVAATQLPKSKTGVPALVFIWAILILSTSSLSFLFTGYFFNWPRPIRPNEPHPQRDRRDTDERESPPSIISPSVLRRSIPNGAIPSRGPLRIEGELLSGDDVYYANTGNVSNTRTSTDYLVLHRTESNAPLRNAIAQLQSDYPMSAHVVIDKDGTTVQLVPFNRTAWHCREINKQSIGIELVGMHGTPLPEAQIGRLTAVLRLLQAKFPASQLTLHREIAPERTTCPGTDFPFDEIKRRIHEPGA
ncbi:MAG TPA: N-acetylmuramoyl-L-alanine amidase [Chthoniobacterales bacterium]|nr:N-acetylmuramoyl-L-alanine amidase [Chthoniobacterales bacterium]